MDRGKAGPAHYVRKSTGLKIGAVRGIEIRLDLSVAIIFVLVVYSLAAGVFPDWHQDWTAARSWAMAVAAGLLFFVSLLAHELAHSVVAQLRGIAVPRITLFVFGGISEMEREPDTPASEFLIAIVGPATSFLLGLLFTWLGLALAGESFAAGFFEDPEAAMAALGSPATLLLWLGPVNLFLGLFNLIPGFPLDGGRVFRAAVWWATGDLERATRLAANAGRGFAWGLMALGGFGLLQGRLVEGAWLILIGWFIQTAARSSEMQLVLRRALMGLSVRDLMRTRFEVVGPSVPLGSFLEECLLRSGQAVWPVVDDGRLIGTISFGDVQRSLESGRGSSTVGSAMQAIGEHVGPGVGGRDALQALLRSELDPLPVVENGRIVGMLHRSDIMRWLAVHQLKAGDG